MPEIYETEIERGDDCFPVEVQYEYFPGHPGKINCPVDESFPPEPCEVRIFAIIVEDTGEVFEPTSHEENVLVEEIINWENP